MDENLWNGVYYEHQIWPPRDENAIAPGLRHYGNARFARPESQLGAGCLVDQMVGQFSRMGVVWAMCMTPLKCAAH
jgi:hypothetical protein